MAKLVRIRAGETLKRLYGHVVHVSGQRLVIGPGGELSVNADIAKRLLAQSGWVPYPLQASDEKPAAKAVDGPATAPRAQRGKRKQKR